MTSLPLEPRQHLRQRCISKLASGLVLALLLCPLIPLAGTTAWAVTAKPRPATPAPALPMRLSPDVVPQAYALALRLDPAQPGHSGQVEIDLHLRQPMRSMRLHAQDLVIPQAWLTQGSRRFDAKLRRLDAENIALDFARPLATGPAQLTLQFSGKLQNKAVYGLFRQQEGGRWYAMTQFEATGARLAFPLFDEPGWKVPWALSLTVPQALTAVANTPALSESPAEAGWTAWPSR